MEKIIIFVSFLILSSVAIAGSPCEEDCTGYSGNCLQLGLRNRAAVLHLKEIISLADQKVPNNWNRSSCKRSLKLNGSLIRSVGTSCTERGDPRPGQQPNHNEGGRSTLPNEFSGQIVNSSYVSFDTPARPDFVFLVHGNIYNGGTVYSVANHPDGRLLIETPNLCYSID